MATFLVTNLNDSGAGSLRAAIQAANADLTTTPTRIEFRINGVIELMSALPSITNDVVIDATSAPAYALGQPSVQIDFNAFTGLVFANTASGSKLFGLSITGANGNGITLLGNGITVDKNFIGIGLSGAVNANSGDGIYIAANTAGNRIGLNESGASGVIGNVIAGNGGNGITLFDSDNNILVANRIGTDPSGQTKIANAQNGIWLTAGSSNNTIGGTLYTDSATGQTNNPTGNKGTIPGTFVVPPLGNLVSGNTLHGIRIDEGSQSNVLNGNFVGTKANGNSALGNGLNGVLILNANNNSLIGCTFVDEPFVYYNVISGNGANGLQITNSDNVVVQANFFGAGANNASLVGNALNGILVDGNSRNTQVGGVIPLGNVSGANGLNGIQVADTVTGFETFNTFGGLFAFQGAAPNGENGILITSTGGNNLIRTNVFSGNTKNGIELSGNATGVTVDPNIVGLNTIGNGLLPNGGHGLEISGNANNNTIGGYLQSVIPRNIFSGNVGYGIAILENAANNFVFNSSIGTGSVGLTALGNQAGGVLLASAGANNQIGAVTTDAKKPLSNLISGNLGNGITLLYGVSGQEIIGNQFGLDRFGLETLPNRGEAIAVNGSFSNTILSNTGTHASLQLGLPPQNVSEQVQALYIGFFGRAGDVSGVNYWTQQTLGLMMEGNTLAQALEIVSIGFASSTENAPYNQLANVKLNSANPEQVALASRFINQTYQQLFQRSADSEGLQYWLGQLFSGSIPYSDLVYSIANAAYGSDQTVLANKMVAGSYFTQLVSASGVASSNAANVTAVQNVANASSLYASKAQTDLYTQSPENALVFSSIFSENFITGVRGLYDGKVVLTGNKTISGSVNTQAILYEGPMQNTASGMIYVLTPSIAGQTVTSATFYGPDTSVFNPSIGAGNIRAVGSYKYTTGGNGDHGMLYTGPINGKNGTWLQMDVPSSAVGGAQVANTIPHSTMGNLVVGDYDLVGTPASGNAFIYHIADQSWSIMNLGPGIRETTAYGIWQNGIGSNSYTIAGGSRDGLNINKAFLIDYNATTREFSNLKYFTYEGRPELITHFEGITGIPGGYNLISSTDSGPAFATVKRNADGSFGNAQWTLSTVPGSSLTTGNSVYQDTIMGVYAVSTEPGNIDSYGAQVDQSLANANGGLIMPVGALGFNYATTVDKSIGSLIVGASGAGNVLGGSMGNDLFVGTQSRVHADTIYTGGGADAIWLAANRTVGSRISLYSANEVETPHTLIPGATIPGIAQSVIAANGTPQLGWWGQATGKVGGPSSDAQTTTGFGTGISTSMSQVHQFVTGSSGNPIDSINLSGRAYSHLLRDANDASTVSIGNAIIDRVRLGETVDVANTSVIVVTGTAFANAAALAQSLSKAPTAIGFGSAQTNVLNHFIVAYEDLSGHTRIADMSIRSNTAFTNTANGATLAISDLVQLVGVDLDQLQAGNIQFLL